MNSTNQTKHESANPIQKYLIGRFYNVVKKLISDINPVSVLDAGCGEGFTLRRLKEWGIGQELKGMDISASVISEGHRLNPGLDLEVGDISKINYPGDSFDLVLCLEVLEHLPDPASALNEVMRVSREHSLFSVPNEPWFRLANFFRGKYISRLGNHPEHINRWSKAEFTRLLAKNNFTLIRISTSFPWTLALVKKDAKLQ